MRGGNRLSVCGDAGKVVATRVAGGKYIGKDDLLEKFGRDDVSVKIYPEWSE